MSGKARTAFEAWISAPPYEANTRRLEADSAWPGCYQDGDVHLAWDAWQEALRHAAGVCREQYCVRSVREQCACAIEAEIDKG